MIERRLAIIIAGLTVFFVSAVLWNVFTPSRHRPPRAAPVDSTSVVTVRADTAVAPARGPGDTTVSRGGQSPAPLAPPVSAGTSGPSYMELLARSETRRRIRASAGYTYLNEVVAQSEDSMLHRWDNRIFTPVRVFLGPGTAANFQPGFLDADSTSAEVRFHWRLQFEIQRTGQTDLTWDQDGHLVSGVVTLATFDPAGRPLAVDDVRVVALHEIGHLIGLDHSSDSTDIMFAMTKVRDLSPKDIASALLLYQLPPGTLR